MKYMTSRANGKTYPINKNTVRILSREPLYWGKTHQEIYDAEFIGHDRCVVCGEKAMFINFVRGYKPVCKHCAAAHSNIFIEGYDEYVLSHYEEYLPLWGLREAIDPFDGEHYIGKAPFRRHVLMSKCRHEKNSSFWAVRRACKICGRTFNISIMTGKNIGGNVQEAYMGFTDEVCTNCIRHNVVATDEGSSSRLRFVIDGIVVDTTVSAIEQYFNSKDYVRIKKSLLDSFGNSEVATQVISQKKGLWSILNRMTIDDAIVRNILLDIKHTHKYKAYKDVVFNGLPIRVFYDKKWKSLKWWGGSLRYTGVTCANCGKPLPDDRARHIYRYDDATGTFVRKQHYCNQLCARSQQVFTPDTAAKLSRKARQRVRDGWRPPVVNSLTRRAPYLKEYPEYKFRSKWEAAFWYLNKDTLPYETTYESIRIPYVDGDGKARSYIPDFVDSTHRIVYEIKPDTMRNKPRNILKEKAAREWCTRNGYVYTIVGDDWFRQKAVDGERFTFLGASAEHFTRQFYR